MNNASPVVIAVFILVWLILPILIASQATHNRGRGGLIGLLLGLFLGWIGVIIALLLSDIGQSGAGQKNASHKYRECPYCKEQMRRDALVCPQCHKESSAWTLSDGVWWHRGESGWYALDEPKSEWVHWEGDSLEIAEQTRIARLEQTKSRTTTDKRLLRQCPECMKPMRRDASTCPHCRAESGAWTLKDGAWWCKADSGWQRLDEKRNVWVKVEQPSDSQLVV